MPGGARQAARPSREARRRQRVITFIALAAAARMAVDKRTVLGVIVVAVALVAVKGLAGERGTPLLDWYRAIGRTERDQA